MYIKRGHALAKTAVTNGSYSKYIAVYNSLMKSKRFKFTFPLILMLEVMFEQGLTEPVSRVAEKVSKVSNAVSNLKLTKEATNTLTKLENKALNAVTGGKIVDASTYVQFLLFTRKSENNYKILKKGDKKAILEAGFNELKNTKVLVPGWTTNGTDPFPTQVRQAFLKKEDLNIISVNWPKMSKQPYSVAYTAVPYVGEFTALFVDFLVKTMGVKPSSIHVIGYSLGAHIAGTVGEHMTSGKLPRITGLDPAGPLFTSQKKGRLDASDAAFVDVIHTSAGTVGYADPCGSVDFYPNGGFAPQPGCNAIDPSCSHGRAYQYFAESVSKRSSFQAWGCDSWESFKKGTCSKSLTTVMGYHVDLRSKGVYYLETNSKKPFAKGV